MDKFKNRTKLISRFVTYSGTSMYPVLRETDILKVNREIVPLKGDIVFFKDPVEKNNIIHRICAIEGEKIYTKGDSSREPDPWSLKQADIKGVITHAYRNKRVVHVLNRYHSTGILKQSIEYLLYSVYRFIRPVYKAAALKGFFYNLLPEHIKPQPVIFSSGNTVKLCLFINKTRVARYDDIREKWYIKPPFGFFINKKCMDRARIKLKMYLLAKQ